MRRYVIEPREDGFAVLDAETGALDYMFATRADAEERIEALLLEQVWSASTLTRRAVYNRVDRDPVARAMRDLWTPAKRRDGQVRSTFPRKGTIETNTQRHYREALGAEWSKHLSPSRPKRTLQASEGGAAKGAATRQRVAELWGSLADVPERNRATEIARRLHRGDHHVRQILRILRAHKLL